MSEHYDKFFEVMNERNLAIKKTNLLSIIDKASNDEIKYLYKVAVNIKGYMQFETLMKNIFGDKNVG